MASEPRCSSSTSCLADLSLPSPHSKRRCLRVTLSCWSRRSPHSSPFSSSRLEVLPSPPLHRLILCHLHSPPLSVRFLTAYNPSHSHCPYTSPCISPSIALSPPAPPYSSHLLLLFYLPRRPPIPHCLTHSPLPPPPQPALPHLYLPQSPHLADFSHLPRTPPISGCLSPQTPTFSTS